MSFTYITGSGTQANPYVISDVNGWKEWSSYVLAGNDMEGEYVELSADIGTPDFSDMANRNDSSIFPERIGSYSIGYYNGTTDLFFSGNFNGNNHHLYIYSTLSDYYNNGLIRCGKNAKIENCVFYSPNTDYEFSIVYTIGSSISSGTYGCTIKNCIFQMPSSRRPIQINTYPLTDTTKTFTINIQIDSCIFNRLYSQSNLKGQSPDSYIFLRSPYNSTSSVVTLNYTLINSLFINAPTRPTPSRQQFKGTINYNIQKNIIYILYHYPNTSSYSDCTIPDANSEYHNYFIYDGPASNYTSIFPSGQWTYLSTTAAKTASNYSNLDFINDFSIDSALNVAVPKNFAEQYVLVFAKYNGNASEIDTNQAIPDTYYSSSDALYKTYGRCGLVPRGSNLQFGLTSARVSNVFNILKITNLTTGNIGDDNTLYQNIQTNIISAYTIEINLTSGSGTVNDPYLISNYQNLVSYLLGFYWKNYFTNYNINLSNIYSSITNDIICNDVTDFLSWNTTQPSNIINDYCTGFCGYIEGNNHKIIGLYADGLISKATCHIKNIKFDYILSKIGVTNNSNQVIENCEFNGFLFIAGREGIINIKKCYINLMSCFSFSGTYGYIGYNLYNTNVPNLSSMGSMWAYNYTNNNQISFIESQWNSNDWYTDYSSILFEDCVINTCANFRTLSSSNSLTLSFNRCVFYGRYCGFDDTDISITDSYIIKSSLLCEPVTGLTVIEDDNSTNQSLYTALDFTNVFSMGSKYPNFKNRPKRFIMAYVVTNNEFSNNETITQTGGRLIEKDNQNHTMTITLTLSNQTYLKTLWCDNNSDTLSRTFTFNDDFYLHVNVYPKLNDFEGNGSEDSPFLIHDKAELDLFSTRINSLRQSLGSSQPYMYVKLTDDIQYQDDTLWEQWETTDAEESFTPIQQFYGEFDGDNHTISGLYRKQTQTPSSSEDNTSFDGLFMYSLYYGAYDKKHVIKNLTIDNSVLNINSQCYKDIMGFCSAENAVVLNCKFHGKIIVNKQSRYPSLLSVGGFCSFGASSAPINPRIEHCIFDGEIKVTIGTDISRPIAIAGIVAGFCYNENQSTGIIKNCTTLGSIEINNYKLGNDFVPYIAGIVACNGYYDVQECYNKMNISVPCQRDRYSGRIHVGGIGAGSHIIKNCYNVGNITLTDTSEYNSKSFCAGILASRDNVTNSPLSSYNYGQITGPSETTGAISSYITTNTVQNCYYLEGSCENAGGGIELTALDFSLPSAFNGFDFVNIWEMDYSAGRPKLKNNYEEGLLSLIVTSSNEEYGIVTGGGEYPRDTIVQITAITLSGNSFEGWSDGIKTNPRYVLVTRNSMYQALFKGGYPTRFLDYYGLVQFLSKIKNYIAGLLSTKMDKISGGSETTPIYLVNGSASNCNLPTVTTSQNGYMSAQDKVKLNGISTGATAVSFTPTLTSGVKLGVLTINGVNYNLYCKDGGEPPAPQIWDFDSPNQATVIYLADGLTTEDIAQTDGVTDRSENNNEGTGFGGVGVVNNATFGCDVFSFDGTNDYIRSTKSGILNIIKSQSQYSVSMKLMTNNVNSGKRSAFSILIDSTGFIIMELVLEGSTLTIASRKISGETKASITTTLQINTMYHFIVTLNYTTGKMTVYKDGSILNQVNTTTTGVITTDIRSIEVGRYSTGQYWNGYIDDIRMYSRALSDSEALELYQNTCQTS